jgi:hypothetical protein
MKICKRCGSDSNGYYPQLRNKDGLRPYCKMCDKAQSRITYNKNKELLKMRKLRLKEIIESSTTSYYNDGSNIDL